MQPIVAKFGGTSLADANQVRKVIDIVRSDPRRRFVVVSAPGKRSANDRKITDLLYEASSETGDSMRALGEAENRFQELVRELRLSFQLDPHIQGFREYRWGASFLVSRGEYLMARILAEALGYEFVDAADVIRIDADGTCADIERGMQKLAQLPKRRGFVIPGFYGAGQDGSIRTFSRGGSDLTGALVAAMVGADVYENWTDVSGLRMADPEVVPDARRIETLTYRELRELTYMGARVLHDEVVFPLRRAGIPIHVRNTNDPESGGTLIVPERRPGKPGSIVGIAGRKDFTIITIEKSFMNREIGFLRRTCAVLERHGVNIEHLPGGIDTISVVAASEALESKLEYIERELEDECRPDSVAVYPGIALVCVVGTSMAYAPGVAARLFGAVADAGVNVRIIDQGSSELSIMLGVKNGEYERTVRAIYKEFATG